MFATATLTAHRGATLVTRDALAQYEPPWLTDKTLDYHATASWNSRGKKRGGCFWCWILEAMAGTGSASANKCRPVMSS